MDEFENWKEMEKFLENLSKMSQVEKESVYSLITMRETDSVVKKSSDTHKKSMYPDSFIGEF